MTIRLGVVKRESRRVGIPQVEAQLFIFYVACHTGDIVNSVYCFKLTVVRVMY